MPDKLKAWFSGANRVRLITALGLLGMGLILLSGLHHAPADAQQTGSLSAAADAAASYRSTLEARLTELLRKMEGVGTVSVMVTVSGTPEQIYAEEVKQTKSDRQTQRESQYVLTKNGSAESALVAETRYPSVCGVAVLCSGGGHAAVRERVTKAVATVLGLPASRIFVGVSG